MVEYCGTGPMSDYKSIIRFETTGPIFGIIVIAIGLVLIGATEYTFVRVGGGFVMLFGLYFVLFRSFRRLTVEEMVRNDYLSWDEVPMLESGDVFAKRLTGWDWNRVGENALAKGDYQRAEDAFIQAEQMVDDDKQREIAQAGRDAAAKELR
jgi:hypothetical protein